MVLWSTIRGPRLKVPKSFDQDLHKVHEGDITVADFLETHHLVLRRLAKHALRYRTEWYISDEDDMYQEACYWLVRALWDWDEDRGTELGEYVLYNIGARLNTTIRVERAGRRHPDRNTSRKVPIWDIHDEGLTVEETLPNPSADPELRLAIKQAFDKANAELTGLARELVVVLIEENGNLAAAARRLVRRKHIRRRFGSDPNYLKYKLNKLVGKEISDFFEPTAIIPADGKRV